MAGLEPLLTLIYHEKQQSGSQLCAQHALNAVLQGDYFQAPDLAQFAQHLDQLEGSVNEDVGPNSNNMDDTGFFSVDVLEGALRVWGFTLVRWRNPILRNEQDRPQAQMAFILNHQQHWFGLRRFGDLSDPGNGHWFNLNSFLPAPEWVSKLYLGMVLSQAEDEGYSVFAVRPINEEPGATLPHTEADDIAMTLPQPTSAAMTTRLSTDSRHAKSDASQNIPGLEDEDLELQAALQASLTGHDYDNIPSLPTATNQSSTARVPAAFPDARREVDDVAASMARDQARNRAIIERMRMEQEMAYREYYEENQNFIETPNIGRRRTTGEEEEEEAIRRAIEYSRADSGEPYPPENALELSSDNPSTHNDRVYDDENSELQAALKASLEGLPEGFVIPPTPPQSFASSSRLPSVVDGPTVEESVTVSDEVERKSVEIDAEELRKRRLARFGSGK